MAERILTTGSSRIPDNRDDDAFPFVTLNNNNNDNNNYNIIHDNDMNETELLPRSGLESATDGSGNASTSNSTRLCSNDYCVSDEDYVEMIRNYIFPTTYEWVLVLLYLVVFVIGLVGNFLVCFVVWRNRQMRTVTNLFIVNLSVADFLVVLVCLPPTVIVDITETWYLGRVLCKIVHYVQSVSVSVSVLTLTVISIERFYAICYPLKFRSTKRRARIMILLIWIISLAILVPELVVLDLEQRIRSRLTNLLTSCKPSWQYHQQTTYQLFLSVAMFFAPLGLMAFTYIRIAITLWNNVIPAESGQMLRSSVATTGSDVGSSSTYGDGHGGRIGAGGGPLGSGGSGGGGGGVRSGGVMMSARTNDIASQMAARRNVAKMLIAVVWMFAICYLPVHLLNVLRYAQWGLDGTAVHFALIAHWLCYFNSAINPVIYNFMSAKFRKEFKDACRCCGIGCFCRRRESDVHSRNVSRSYSAYKYGNSVTQTENITMTTVNNRYFNSD